MPADRPAPKKAPKSHHLVPELKDLIRCQRRTSKLTADVARLICQTEKHIAQLESHLTKARQTQLVTVLKFPL